MNEEEKEAIEKLDYELTYSWVHNQGISKETLKLFKDIIEKQQKEIEDLKFKYQARKDRTKAIIEGLQEELEENENKYDDFTTAYMQGFYDGKNKFKDKIKAKAEELDNQQRQWREDRTNKHTDAQIIYARDVLEELLGE